MSIILTEAAATEINRIIEEQNLEELKYVRIGVVGGGCSGFQYDFNFTDKFDSKMDTMQEQHGVGVVVDKKSDLFLLILNIIIEARIVIMTKKKGYEATL